MNSFRDVTADVAGEGATILPLEVLGHRLRELSVQPNLLELLIAVDRDPFVSAGQLRRG
jgi:hypothetical protein